MKTSTSLKNKIIKHFKNNYNSSPHPITNEKIDFLIKNDCQCDNCGASIFELDDFPEILIEDNELLCDDCYHEKYNDICPICEDYYDTKDYTSDYFVLTEYSAKELKMIPGIYKILERPFFYGDILSGFDAFFSNSIELAVPIKINELKKIECGDNCQEVTSDCLCPDCIAKYVRKKDYLHVDVRPCLLVKKYEDEYLKKYTSEQLHVIRQNLIHKRITCRGIVEKANHADR
jgi:hypothetical protein